ncbi:KAT8 regulatory NSL complex subunit 2-like [Artemia franciscana]|uniref:KAT8 regulatory NSL complex subunit 2-like n=1 Tax=Artemia franciscana TaxID=6661 RepID=UPI0032DA59FB
MDYSNSIENILKKLNKYSSTENSQGNEASSSGLNTSKAEASVIDPAVDISSDESEADIAPMLVDHTFVENADSDADSIDSDMDDPLRNAGVYTVEEVVTRTKERLIRLQSQYVEQFSRLNHCLREQRRMYLHSVKKEKELPGFGKLKDIPSERKNLKKLRHHLRYHRVFGKENLLFLQAQEKRLKVTEGSNFKAQPVMRCSYSEGKLKCQQQVIPLSKFCFKHILKDKEQFLFRGCTAAIDSMGKEECLAPVFTLSATPVCDFHCGATDIDEQDACSGAESERRSVETRVESGVVLAVSKTTL